MCWSIWLVRNDLIFRGIQPSVQRCKGIFKKEFAQVIVRAKAAYKPHISQWLEGLCNFINFLLLSLFRESICTTLF